MLDINLLHNQEEMAESSVIKKFGNKFKEMDMLDVGVGGGRTTKYFAPLMRSYIGMDYAPAMIRTCEAKYGGKYYFVESDVRFMNIFGNSMFDFVLFSYNGIDSFCHEDRLIALMEIRRVLRNNGYFCFSSHNLNWKNLPNLFSFKSNRMGIGEKNGSGSFITLFGNSIKSRLETFRLNILNGNLLRKNFIQEIRENQKGLLFDNSLNGRASVYYITRDEQIKQLEDAGFKNVTTYSRNGINIEDEDELNRGGWIYYLCQVDK